MLTKAVWKKGGTRNAYDAYRYHQEGALYVEQDRIIRQNDHVAATNFLVEIEGCDVRCSELSDIVFMYGDAEDIEYLSSKMKDEPTFNMKKAGESMLSSKATPVQLLHFAQSSCSYKGVPGKLYDPIPAVDFMNKALRSCGCGPRVAVEFAVLSEEHSMIAYEFIAQRNVADEIDYDLKWLERVCYIPELHFDKIQGLGITKEDIIEHRLPQSALAMALAGVCEREAENIIRRNGSDQVKILFAKGCSVNDPEDFVHSAISNDSVTELGSILGVTIDGEMGLV